MSPDRWLPLRYRDFYDVPRLIAVEYGGHVYLLDSPFDEQVDEYSDEYRIYRLPDSARSCLKDPSWDGLAAAGEEIGRVPVGTVEFDETRRLRLDSAVLRRVGIH